MHKTLVIDIGGTYIKYAHMDDDMKILDRGKIQTPQGNRQELVDALVQLYRLDTEIKGIGISMPGIIDADNGYILMGGALRYNDDFYLRHALYEHCPVPIHIENDAKCAAMAEAGAGALKDVEDGFALIFGTMIGGGLIRGHKLQRGGNFSAGEVSYIISGGNQYPVREAVWGNRCGVPGLCRKYAERKHLDPSEVDGVRFFADVNAGDEIAAECLKEFCHEIAVQIFNIQTILDPVNFAIGGGISAQPVFVETIREELKELYSVCPYYLPQARVLTCKFQNDANLYGAFQCLKEEL